MSALTFLGLVIAVFTGLIFREQLHEMKTDQRAWISLDAGEATFPKSEEFITTVPVSVPVTVNNIGKTAARTVHVQLVMDYIVNGQSPDFAYIGRPGTVDTTGIIFPNKPFPIVIVFSKDKEKGASTEPISPLTEPKFLTTYEYQSLNDGHGYMVIYAHATYLDIFGTEHWLNFCTFFVAPGAVVNVTARACTDYNDTDHN